MILQYGNLKILSVHELDEGLFPGQHNLQGIRIYSDDKWKLHKADIDIFGINIEVGVVSRPVLFCYHDDY